MPLYEYICNSCQKRTEILQRLGEAPATECPNCGGVLRKLISAPAFQFKGSGWYLTDYANRSGGSGDGAATKAAGDQAGAGEKGSADQAKEAKPAENKADSSSQKSESSAPVAKSESGPAAKGTE